MKTATFNMRIDAEIKEQAEDLFSSFGITVSDAVTMFLYKSVAERGLPFELKQKRYNKETERGMAEVRRIAKEVNAGRRKPDGSFEDLLKELNIDV